MTLSWYPWPQKDTWYSNQKFVQNFKIFPFWILRNNIHSHLFFFFFPSTPPRRTICRWWTPHSTWPTGPCNRTEQESAGWNTSVTYLAVTFFDSSTVATNVSPYHQHGAQRQVKSKYLKQRIRSVRFKVGRKAFFFSWIRLQFPFDSSGIIRLAIRSKPRTVSDV